MYMYINKENNGNKGKKNVVVKFFRNIFSFI